MSEIFPKQQKDYLKKALNIVEKLYAEKRLAPVDHWIIDELKQRLTEL